MATFDCNSCSRFIPWDKILVNDPPLAGRCIVFFLQVMIESPAHDLGQHLGSNRLLIYIWLQDAIGICLAHKSVSLVGTSRVTVVGTHEHAIGSI